MTAKILSAAPVVAQIKKGLITRCEALKKQGIIPSMCVVLVGNSPASMSYIRNKKRMCEEVGAHFTLLHLPEDIETSEFLREIEKLNEDPAIHGIIIQLPVSKQLKDLPLPNLITPIKDIDGFHGINTQNLYSGSTDLSLLLPCTPKGIVNLLRFYQIDPKGKTIVVVGRSLIVGKPLSMLLSNLDATVIQAHSQTHDLPSLTKQADIVISAIGRANFFDQSYFDPKRKSVVIDVGINSLNGKLTGDMDQESIKEVVSAMTPVPGGVGPMTVISLIENLICATEKQSKDSK